MDHRQMLEELREPTKALRHAIPQTWADLQALHGAAMADGVLPTSLKEGVALAISVAKRCEGCIAFHAKAAADAGATAEEVGELLGVALLMEGGPAAVYAPIAFEAFLEFQASGSAAGGSS